jgi:hypothetical protein
MDCRVKPGNDTRIARSSPAMTPELPGQAGNDERRSLALLCDQRFGKGHATHTRKTPYIQSVLIAGLGNPSSRRALLFNDPGGLCIPQSLELDVLSSPSVGLFR